VKISVKDLLRRALMVGAKEVKLVPGRRTIVITDAGENEVRGDTMTPERINAMLESVLTSEARRSLSTGFAEWSFELSEHGPVHVTAELRMGVVHASFNLEGGAALGGALQVPVPEALEASFSPGSLRGEMGPRPEEPRPIAVPYQPNPTQPSMRKAEPDVGRGDPVPRLESNVRGEVSAMPTTSLMDRLLRKMVELKASDLHLCVGAPPMVRLDGDMVPMPGENPLDASEVRQILWPIVPPRNQNEFEDTKDTDFAYEIPGLARFRSNVFVDLRGLGAVLRVIPSKILTVEQLGLPSELLSLCNLSKGLVVVTGPTGSGKSTTLAALVDYINRTRKAHIITIEDPVEFVHQNQMSLLNQRQVGEHTKSFKAALRAALREDPDIVLLGEMRDLETIAIAIETAETGHLVFGTLHTSSAPSTIDRIIDQFPTNQQNQVRTMLSGSLKGVIAQMLCKKKGGGRVAALEVMMGVPAIANLIREGKIFQIPSVMQTSRNIGMRMMNDSLFDLVKAGKVEADEALSKSNEKSTLQNLLRQAGINFSASA
jgi:twitching motility protein PilT